ERYTVWELSRERKKSADVGQICRFSNYEVGDATYNGQLQRIASFNTEACRLSSVVRVAETFFVYARAWLSLGTFYSQRVAWAARDILYGSYH
ncbi:2153_t:CDS:1, partial [Paraglomus brasilianum]